MTRNKDTEYLQSPVIFPPDFTKKQVPGFPFNAQPGRLQTQTPCSKPPTPSSYQVHGGESCLPLSA